MKYCKNKDMNRMIRHEIKEGARFLSGRKHGKLLLSNGALLVVSKSPSDWRAHRNARARLRALKNDTRHSQR